MQRRSFLRLAVGAAAALAGTGACTGDRAVPGDLAALVRTFLTDLHGAAQLGEGVDDDLLETHLADLLPPPGHDPDAWFATASVSAFAARVRTAVAADHAAGRFAVVEGWWLTHTEAALCGVAAAVVAGRGGADT